MLQSCKTDVEVATFLVLYAGIVQLGEKLPQLWMYDYQDNGPATAGSLWKNLSVHISTKILFISIGNYGHRKLQIPLQTRGSGNIFCSSTESVLPVYMFAGSQVVRLEEVLLRHAILNKQGFPWHTALDLHKEKVLLRHTVLNKCSDRILWQTYRSTDRPTIVIGKLHRVPKRRIK